jgi:hypothetical protein
MIIRNYRKTKSNNIVLLLRELLCESGRCIGQSEAQENQG